MSDIINAPFIAFTTPVIYLTGKYTEEDVIQVSKSVQANSGLMTFEGKPSWGVSLPQAMQHVLAMLIGNIILPMLIAALCDLSVAEKIMLTQAAMIIARWWA